MANGGGFSIAVRVVDQASPTLDKASKSVDAYRNRWVAAQKTLKNFDKTGREALKGIVDPRAAGALADIGFAAAGAGVRATRAFKEIGKSAADTVDQLSRFAPQLQVLAGVATVAGIGRMVSDFGRFGIETTKTAAALDLSVKDVQAYSRAWEKAGLSAEQFVQSHASINQALVEARAGRNLRPIAASGLAQSLHLGGVDYLHASAKEVRKQVANIVRRMHRLHINVETQMQFAEAFGIPRDEIELLQRGGDAIQDLHDKTAATVVVSSDLVNRGKQLGESLIGLGQSATVAGQKIAGDLEPKLRPLVDGFAHLLDDIDKMPGGMATAETAIGAVLGLFTVEVAARMKTVSFALKGIKFALIGLAALTPPGWLLALLGLGTAAGLAATGSGASNQFKEVTPGLRIDPESGLPNVRRRHGEGVHVKGKPQPTMMESIGHAWRSLENTVQELFGGPAVMPAPSSPRQRPPTAPGLLNPAAYRAISQAEGTFRGGKIDYDTLLGYGRWGRPDKPVSQMNLQELSDFGIQMRRAQAAEGKPWEQTSSALGAFQITGSNVRDYAAAHGLDMSTTRFTPELQQAMATEIAHRQGSAAWEGFKTHPDLRQAFDREIAMPDLTAGAAPPVQLGKAASASGETPEADAGDTSHEVTVRFVDAPPGLRSGISRADGPARLAVRTQFAMPAPF